MTHAYDERYLEQAANTFASMMDYAVNDCDLTGNAYLQMLRITGIDKYIEHGNPSYIAGRSGVEIAGEVIKKTNLNVILPAPKSRYHKNAEYWAGWALAKLQWYSGLTFKHIQRFLPFDEILALYPTHHEADITKFYASALARFQKAPIETNLKRHRANWGYSQAELARKSGVSLRSIQMYEQRRKDINKAQAIIVSNLAKALSCDMSDLLEYAP